MVLVSELKYETRLKILKDISPQGVLEMLRDVRSEIGKLEGSFASVGLKRVLEVVEKGGYKVNGHVLTRIDLSSAKEVVEAYREHSEGGCQSCVSLGGDVINDDMDTFFYCEVREDHERTPKKCGYNTGLSPETEKHYESPCGSWKPRFSPPLEKLLQGKN